MKIKAVSFDVGNTLVRYNNPLNWKTLYIPALEQVVEQCRIRLPEDGIEQAASVLTKYNTRENPREKEVSSETIFKEILDVWGQPYHLLPPVKSAFYGFFQADAVCYEDAVDTLQVLRSKGVKVGALTDVAYGMDDSFSLQDIAAIQPLFDLVLTSVDVGYRKPHKAGFLKLLQEFHVSPSQMMYVGDEQKDIVGANSLGIVSVLINRDRTPPDWGQTHNIQSLQDLCQLI
ncbi:MAG: HAD family hydrolase [Oscillospiraceae bacterium]|nr:HAD family hydrolase [Oscillospiraceae bacterium]